jgi:DNA-binding LacI/PurR family transcriptional regulator
MLDVARLAGVSHQTVSRVLNEHPSVRPETRARVETALRVPEDLSVVGFDDIEIAAYARPPLTTVRQDFGELGLAAVRTLVGQMAGDPDADRHADRAYAAGPGQYRTTS